jgi:alkanesulfonate monooxygenase SsuD/methylene tetrahydromethanopterin reductase-like flavin-dependent oxidoreductase (luciferase family)
MQIGIALPNTVPGLTGAQIVEWATRAERRGFSSVAVTERLVYPGYEPLIALAAVAAVTTRVSLLTDILVAPLRSSALLAKQAANVAQLAGRPFTLGLAPGVRNDDFEAVEVPFRERGARFDRLLTEIHDAWAGAPVNGVDGNIAQVPEAHRPRLMFGGLAEATAQRVARWGADWAAPGLNPKDAVAAAEPICRAWSVAGRPGRPRIVTLLRFVLGEEHVDASTSYVRDYFAVMGPAAAEEFARDTPRTEMEIKEAVRIFADAGVDEFILNPTVIHPEQVDRLADIIF